MNYRLDIPGKYTQPHSKISQRLSCELWSNVGAKSRPKSGLTFGISQPPPAGARLSMYYV